MIANSPEHGQAVPSLSHRTTRLWRFFTIMLLTCVMLFAGRMVPAGPAHMAMADDETDTATQTTALSITESTPVVTDTSGYHITISISNPTYAATSPGLVTVAYNPSYTFVSRTDIQHWATGDVSIPVRTVLGTATVPSIAANKKVSVKIDAAADSDALKALQMWGPKPLLVTYQATQATDSQSTGSSDGSSGSDRTVDPNTKPIRLHSFLTRSSQGLRNAQTPPMAITMVMPLMNTGQQADKNAIDQLVVHDNGEESDTKSTQSGGGGTDDSTDDGSGNNTDDTENTAATQSSVLTPHDNDALAAKLSLIGKHSDLQTIADPTALASDTGQRIDAVMQPAGFDITAYAAIRTGRGTGIIRFPAHRLARQGRLDPAGALHGQEAGIPVRHRQSRLRLQHHGHRAHRHIHNPHLGRRHHGAERAEGTRRPRQRQAHQQ